MRLIDADELKNLPFERLIHTDFGDTAIPIKEIDNAPTVEYPFYAEAYQTGYEEGKNERPQGDLISREALKDLLARRGLYGERLFDIIDNAPAIKPCDNCDLYFKAMTKEEMKKGGAE